MDLLLQNISFIKIFVVLVVIYWIAWVIYSQFFHPLSKFPGPFLASISRWGLVLDTASGCTDQTQRALHARYGPIVRIAPNELAISDPEAIKTIYATQNPFVKTDFYLPFRPDFSRYPDNFTGLDERVHAQRRRIVNSLYSMSNIIQMEESVNRCTTQLVEKLAECAGERQVVDLANWSQWYAFDVIGELFFSRMFGFMKNASDYKGYIGALDLLIPFIAVALVMPSYIRPLYLVSGAMIPRVFKALQALKFIEKESAACVAERETLLASKPEYMPEDMLQSYFDIMHHKGKEKDFGLTEIKVDAYGSFIAGSDTTAAAITAIFYYLLRNPVAYEKLTAEIFEATNAGLLSATIQYHEAVGLPYLVACIKEGMRLHPSVGMTMPREVPKGGCIINNCWIPGGTRVGMNAAVVQRDRHTFGEDPDQFIPERWLRTNAARMERYMLHFGAGTRTCIGKNISLCEIYKVIPQVIRAFHIEPCDKNLEWKTRNYWFNKPGQVEVRLYPRESQVCAP